MVPQTVGPRTSAFNAACRPARSFWLLSLFLSLPFLASCATAQVSEIAARPSTEPRPRVLFLHRSVGANLIEQGRVRELFSKAGYDFWDHGHNEQGLRDEVGENVTPGFDIPNDNTDPGGYAAIFAQPVNDPPDVALSHVLAYDIIAFKSCYPVSDIKSDRQMEAYKQAYIRIRSTMDTHPDKLFIVVTPPPLSSAGISPANVARGRAFANWLTSDEFLAGHPNIRTFDLFDALANNDNYLRVEYRQSLYPIDFTDLGQVPGSLANAFRVLRAQVQNRPLYTDDSHPNEAANRTVGPVFVRSIVEAYEEFEAARTGR